MTKFDGSKPNYSTLRNKEKTKVKFDVEKIGKVKECAYDILEKDYKHWKTLDTPQPGIERSNFLQKVGAVVPINSNVFDAAMYELEVEQKIISTQDGNSGTRYVLLKIPE